MKKQGEDFETKFRKEVLEFLETKGMTMSKLGWSVSYTNIAKLNEYFIDETGHIMPKTRNKIQAFINEKKKEDEQG